ncbi:MAG: DinB family protein [Chloroflexi bacterium]|nr:MAG: DinB family protein [Chloroflexota bacterium]TMF79276.1 MAG: DinB family protein [Chloroflexota bacterium]TMF92716.1 MAG: DinB family protein [Chloroflexota bacterium]TMG44021.1 MAG: DinB family protein [Chloroflexota bacterium]
MGARRGARGRTARGRRLVGRGADGRQPALPAAGPQTGMNDALFEKLAPSQQLVIAMLRIAAEDSSARVGAWNLRDIAAHLAATERDCYEPRIHAIASGENPSFGFFTNDEDDFSGIQLESALEEWIATRSRLIDYVRALDGEQRGRLTGHHERYGEVTVERYLEIALEHDQDHLRGLERLAGGLTR